MGNETMLCNLHPHLQNSITLTEMWESVSLNDSIYKHVMKTLLEIQDLC